MEKKDFTERYAERTSSTPEEAADEIDSVVNDLLRRLRAGQRAALPGLGILNDSASKASKKRKRGKSAR